MNLRDLEYLVSLADLGHFSRAAAACGISQPTLSTQIMKLEDELGCVLFTRRRRGLRLTAEGSASWRRRAVSWRRRQRFA